MIKSLNTSIQIVRDEELGGLTVAKKTWEVINEKSGILKDKTLIVNADAMFEDVVPIYNEEMFRNKYPYSVEFVSRERFRQILAGNDSKYACLLTVHGIMKQNIIYNIETKDIMFFDGPLSGKKCNENELKSLTETVKANIN
jgi:hypothetical protein